MTPAESAHMPAGAHQCAPSSHECGRASRPRLRPTRPAGQFAHRVDLHLRAVFREEEAVEAKHLVRRLVHRVRRDAHTPNERARLGLAQACGNVDGLLDDGVRHAGRDLLNVHAAVRGPNQDRPVCRAVLCDGGA